MLHFNEIYFCHVLNKDLQKKKIEITPYVNSFADTPDKGFGQFFESPRFATGYTSLFNTIGFVVETHMLKKYADRVKVTYEYMRSAIDYMDANFKKIKDVRLKNEEQYQPKKSYTIKWEIDSTKKTTFPFLGFEAIYKKVMLPQEIVYFTTEQNHTEKTFHIVRNSNL